MVVETAAPLIPAVPLAAFAVILLGGLLPKKSGFGATTSTVIGTLGVFASLVLSAYLAFEVWANELDAFIAVEAVWVDGIGEVPDLSVGVLVDPLSALMALIVSLVAFLVHVFSKYYMNDEGETGLSRYYAVMSLFTGSMLAFVFASNLLMAFIFFELVGLCSYLLIGFWYERPSAASAAKKAFLVTRFGDYFFLVGVVFAFAGFGTFAFHGDGSLFAVAENAISESEMVLGLSAGNAVTVLALLVLGGVIGKSAQFPLHTWLPDAMEGPTPVSALIHAATMVAAGVYLVARTFELYALSPTALLVVAYVGGFTALFAATMALVMDDIKQVLAYSTISQYGYMMLALGAGGYTAAVFHLMNHAFFKALLFLGAGSVIIAMHHEQDMWKMGGLRRRMPVTYWTFLAGSLALAGIAPFSGFWSKDEALLSAFRNAVNEPLLWVPFGFALVGVVVTGFYTFRMVALTFHGSPRTDEAELVEEGGFSVYVPLVVLGLLAVLAGFVNAEPLGIHALSDFLGASSFYEAVAEGAGYVEEFETSLVLSGVAFVLALVGSVAGFGIYAGKEEPLKRHGGAVTRVLEKKYYVDNAQVWLAEGFTYRLSRLLNLFDLDIVDGVVNATSKVSLGSGDAVRRMQTGVVAHYVAIIVLGTVLLGFIVGVTGGWF
ncbi:MAG: NADH-quinone oxidoreductase subunit L [Halobacteriales archaeon]|nr:NADH-quinone oxidoreductase subunit L [Halobacteriales archaeon]